jgi:hypothetical protein
MATTYLITVENHSPSAQNFFFFQEPAVYSGGSKVFINSISNKKLPAYDPKEQTQIQFNLIKQYSAGVQEQLSPPKIGVAQTGLISQVQIDITEVGKTTNNCTEVVFDELYLTPPKNEDGVQNGAFRIKTPSFNPNEHCINVGLGGINDKQNVILTSFINGEPNKNVDVQPIMKFYINVGDYIAGCTVNFTTSSRNAALCDATDGKTNFKVIYNADGTWDVN